MATPRTWRLLRSGAGAPSHNLALDEALLLSGDDRPVLRFYAWEPPALSLGWFQPREHFEEQARALGLEIVRRPTGGGAIHHDVELTFSLVATPGRDGYPAERVEAYRRVHTLVAATLAELGAPVRFRGDDAPLSTRPRDATLCFLDATALDLVDAEGRKVVGSAQRHRGGRVLHHGSIPLEVPALSPSAGSVNLAAGREGDDRIGWDDLADALQRRFAADLCGDLQAGRPDSQEQAAAVEIAGQRREAPSTGPTAG